MKNKILFINILNVIAIIIELIIVTIIAVIHKGWVFIFSECCISLAIIGIINFIFLLVKEIKVLSYDSKKFDPIMFASFTFLGVLLYYVGIYVDYDKFYILLWSLYIAAVVLPIIIFPILNHYDAKKHHDKPKIVVNK